MGTFRSIDLLAGLFVLAVVSSVFGQTSAGPAAVEEMPAALDLTSLEQLALRNNPTMVQAGAQVGISRGKALQAGLHPNPTIGYAGDQIGAEGTAGELQGMFIEQEIVTGGKLQLSRRKYLQEAHEAEIQVLAQQYRVLYGVRSAYYQVLARQRRLELRRQLAANSAEALKTLDELVNVGQANRSDVLRAKVQSQRAQADLRTAERRYQGSWEELTAVVGVPDMPIATLPGTLESSNNKMLDRDTILNNLLMGSPELGFAQAEVERDRIGLQRECVEPVPNVRFQGSTGYNFEVQDTVANVQVGLVIPLWDRNQGTIFQARSELTRAQAEVSRVDLMLRRRFAQVFTDYETATVSAKTYHDEVLPPAEESYRLYLDSFEKHRAAWPQVVDAQRDYFELMEEYLDQLLEARRAEARLNAYLLDDGIQQPPEPSPAGHRDATPRPR